MTTVAECEHGTSRLMDVEFLFGGWERAEQELKGMAASGSRLWPGMI